MNKQMKMCLGWVRLYLETGDAGLTCRRCGISRPTLRLWTRRYQAEGVERSQKTDKLEFYATSDLADPELEV
jgi:transposase-like protein